MTQEELRIESNPYTAVFREADSTNMPRDYSAGRLEPYPSYPEALEVCLDGRFIRTMQGLITGTVPPVLRYMHRT